MDTISEEDKLQQSKTHEKVRLRVLWIKQQDLSITSTQLWPGVVFPWLKDTVWVELSNLERVSLQQRCPSLHCRCCLETTEGLTWLIWFCFHFFIFWIHKITAAIQDEAESQSGQRLLLLQPARLLTQATKNRIVACPAKPGSLIVLWFITAPDWKPAQSRWAGTNKHISTIERMNYWYMPQCRWFSKTVLTKRARWKSRHQPGSGGTGL